MLGEEIMVYEIPNADEIAQEVEPVNPQPMGSLKVVRIPVTHFRSLRFDPKRGAIELYFFEF